MTSEIMLLCGTAASIALIHTVLGPDHYLPFIVMSRAGRWSRNKTALVTILCGIGHVMSSVVIGLIGVFVGVAVSKVEAFEGLRGNVAAWLLIGFGFAYFVWGLRVALLGAKSHAHVHAHADGAAHGHVHTHGVGHHHVHVPIADAAVAADASEGVAAARNMTPWVLFTIFVFGPCEPLIPILMYPAAKHSLSGMVLVAVIFSVITITSMLGIVMLGAWGISLTRLGFLECYTHALAGAMICLSGLAIVFLGL